MKRKWIITIPMAALFLLGFAAALLLHGPIAPCPWCNGEIKHYGGRKRYCSPGSGFDNFGCDGSGQTGYLRRWNSLMEYRIEISRR